MLLQSLPTVTVGDHRELYFRGGELSGSEIILHAGESISFDTYFGVFDHGKFRAHTTLDVLTVRICVFGRARLELVTYGNGEEALLSSTEGEGDVSISLRIDELSEGTLLYPRIKAIDNCKIVSGGYYGEECEKTDRVSFAAVICTYKREEYVKANLRLLSESTIAHLDRIIVVDNGGTLSEKDISSDRILIFKNKNYGGSAGFTRGIIEAKRLGATHVILMDDDIRIYPEALARMTAFASILGKESKRAHFSAAMLLQSRDYVQHEMGARLKGSRIESINGGLDLRKRESLLKSLNSNGAEYGAWWCFAMPLSDVDEYGLPLPLFIKFDDVEYGMRTCKEAPIVTMNGMAVSHADFDLKYSMHLEYYTVRNQLITLAAHKRQGRLGAIARLIKVSAKHLFLYRYEEVPIILRAFDDFLIGAQEHIKRDAEELNRQIMKMAPPDVTLDSVEGYDKGARELYTPKSSPIKAILGILTLGGHVFPSLVMKSKPVCLPLPHAKFTEVFMHSRTVQYQIGAERGYEFKKSSAKFFLSSFKVLKMAFRLLFTYGKAKKSYIKEFEKMTSEEFWNEYLGL